jgi:uncharacterized protein YegL
MSQNFIIKSVKRPNWICSSVKQNLAILRDASGSMSDDRKAEEAYKAVCELIAELVNPSNKDGFYATIIDFAEKAEVKHNLQKVSDLQNLLPIVTGGGTSITYGLEKAFEILLNKENLNSEFSFLKPVILLFTDGLHNHGIAPNELATKIKKDVDIVTVAFGSNADEKTLIELATSPQHFYRCKDGKELRMFLAEVGATLVASMAFKENAMENLAAIKQ